MRNYFKETIYPHQGEELKMEFENLNRQFDGNEILAELYKTLISSEASIEKITHVILTQAKRLTGSQHGYVSYIDQVTRDNIGYTLTEMMEGQCKLDKENQRIAFPIGKDGRYPGLWGHSLNTRQAFYTNDPGKHPASNGGPRGHVPLERFLSLPVMLGDQLVGQIALANPGRDYTDQDLKAVQRLGEFYALSIRNKRVNETLKISEAKYRKLFEEAIDGIVLADAKTGIIIDCNRALAQMVGREKSELIGKPQKILHPAEDSRGQFSKTFKLHLHENEGQVIETQVVTKSGKIKEVAIKANRLELGGRKVLQGMFRDISEQKEAENELRKHRQQLEKLVKSRGKELSAAHEHLHQAHKMEAIGTLASGIAHDFNNILGAIIGYSELAMLDLPDNSITKNNLKYVLSAAERAKDLVKQILTFSRKTKEEKKLVRLSEIVNESVKFLRSTLPATIDISLSVGKNLSPLMANHIQLHQILMNICTNAAHAMRENGGKLNIRLKEIYHHNSNDVVDLAPGKSQQLSNSDTGHGMTPDILERIFDPYFTTKKMGEGTGMGMAVVHGIVKAHKGDITVTSTPGIGTTFHVFLPVIQEEKTRENPVQQTMLTSGKGEHILFVDDEETLTEIGKQTFEKLGYRVTTFTSSVDAVECFRQQPDRFDLLVVDMTMPDMTGLQMAKECKTIRADVPIILCTGFSERVNEKNFKSLGIDAFILKPIRIKEIAMIARRTLNKKTQQGQAVKARQAGSEK